MPAGPFARIIAQVVLIASSVIARTVVQVYKEAAQSAVRQGLRNGNLTQSLKRRMSVEEAAKILEIDINNCEKADVLKRCCKIKEINSSGDNFAGSPYIQKKVDNAQTVMFEDLFDKASK